MTLPTNANSPTFPWREPTAKDCGKAILVFSEELFDDDYNVEGVELAVLVEVDESPSGFLALCTQWCDYQYHWHTIEITENFLVLDVPNR